MDHHPVRCNGAWSSGENTARHFNRIVMRLNSAGYNFMKFIYNALSGVVAMLAAAILALLFLPDLVTFLQIDLSDRLPIVSGLLAVCVLLKPYAARRLLLALIRNASKP